MDGSLSGRTRRRVGCGLVVVFGAWGASASTPGLPICGGPGPAPRRRPPAWPCSSTSGSRTTRWRSGDGLGPVFNARSCTACHFQGGVGGGGGNGHDVLTFKARPTRDRPLVQAGLIHAFAVEEASKDRP